MYHFNAGKNNGDARLRLEAEHRPNAALYATVVLLDAVVQILALANADRPGSASGAISPPALDIAGDDRFAIGLTAIDDDTLGPTMSRDRLAQEALGRRQVSICAQ